MRIKLLDKLLDEYQTAWIVAWFGMGVVALSLGFWLTTEHQWLDFFYLLVSIAGLLCVVGLSFRKNKLGNGLGLLVTAGEVVVQGTAGAVGLMLAPIFNFFTHAYGLYYWSKNQDADGNMIAKSANKTVWALTILFVVVGLCLLPVLNQWLEHQGFAIVDNDGSRFLGRVDFFWINVLAFVLSITAQMAMILRYSLNWWIWIAVNLVWLMVNLMSGNMIFAIQTCIYQVNALVGLYGWHRSEAS